MSQPLITFWDSKLTYKCTSLGVGWEKKQRSASSAYLRLVVRSANFDERCFFGWDIIERRFFVFSCAMCRENIKTQIPILFILSVSVCVIFYECCCLEWFYVCCGCAYCRITVYNCNAMPYQGKKMKYQHQGKQFHWCWDFVFL